MRRRLQGPRDHRRAVAWFLGFWVVLWVITGVTWMYDPEGSSAGMPGWVFGLHLLVLPLAAGALTGGWRVNSGLAGLLASELNLGVIVAWGGVLFLLGRVRPQPGTPGMAGWGGLLEVLKFAVFLGIPGFLLGLLGGFLQRTLRGRGPR